MDALCKHFVVEATLNLVNLDLVYDVQYLGGKSMEEAVIRDSLEKKLFRPCILVPEKKDGITLV